MKYLKHMFYTGALAGIMTLEDNSKIEVVKELQEFFEKGIDHKE